jgi:hypothetical protein
MSGGQVTFESNATTRALRGAAAAASAASAAGARPAAPPAGAGRVDVYGWATLGAMRDAASGVCLDWCAEAMAQLGVSGGGHQHFVCFPLYKPDQPVGAPAVCDNACPGGGDCAASCPADDIFKNLTGVRAPGRRGRGGPRRRARAPATGRARACEGARALSRPVVTPCINGAPRGP